MSLDNGPVASPCNQVCRIDERSGWCLGCRRTLAEIAGWSGMGDAARRAVLAALDARAAPAGDLPSQ